jgi:hypothetical protein
VDERVVIDRKSNYGWWCHGGCRIWIGRRVRVVGQSVAEEIQLMIEYDPAPPFSSGETLFTA